MTAWIITIGLATLTGLILTSALLARRDMSRTRTVVDQAPTEPEPTPEEERVRRAFRELAEATHAISAGLDDAHRYLDTESTEEAHVRLVAAHHQLTDAMHALGRARAALPSPQKGGIGE